MKNFLVVSQLQKIKKFAPEKYEKTSRWKKPPQKKDTLAKLKEFSPSALIAPTAQTVKFMFSNEQLYIKLGWDLNAWSTIYIEDDLLFSLLHTSKATFSFPTDH